MFNSVIKDLRYQFQSGNQVTRLILINVAIFIVLNITFAVVALTAGQDARTIQDNIANFLSIPSDPLVLLKRLWTVITHMFLHRDFFHILWNMLNLFWFGRIVSDLIGDRHITPIYLIGGLAGGLMYIVGINLFGLPGGFALGASAGVMAIIIAAAVISPEYIMHLFLFGPVKIKWIAMVIIILDLAGLANMSNTGGHLGHIGGMIIGWIYVVQLRNGTDLSNPLYNLLRFFNKSKKKKTTSTQSRKKRSPLSVSHKKQSGGNHIADEQNFEKAKDQRYLDEILEKISKNGIESLSNEEKLFLDRMSKR